MFDLYFIYPYFNPARVSRTFLGLLISERLFKIPTQLAHTYHPN